MFHQIQAGICRGIFAHPAMLSFIFHLAFQWSGRDSRCFGIGNISLKDGAPFPPHRTHQSGLEVDIRPLRRDGKETPVNIYWKEYDRKATLALVEAVWSTGLVFKVGFNDRSIPRTVFIPGHDDHLHIVLRS